MFRRAYLIEVRSGCSVVKKYCSRCKASLPNKIGTRYCPTCGRRFVDTKIEGIK